MSEIKPITKRFSLANPICLLGFMGAGKTTVARALAKRLNAEYADLDRYIEAREKRLIADIIGELGENRFRRLETAALKEILANPQNNIVALGGGAWTIRENQRIIAESRARTVWLAAEFELCWQRIETARNLRPLARSKEQARQLFDRRRELYQTAEIHIAVSAAETPDEIAVRIHQQILA